MKIVWKVTLKNIETKKTNIAEQKVIIKKIKKQPNIQQQKTISFPELGFYMLT